MKYLLPIIFVIILFPNQILAQSVTISPNSTSALMDAQSTKNGLVIPRMSMVQRGALTPTQGLQVFCTDCSPAGAYTYTGTQWKAMFNLATGVGDIYSVGQHAQGGVVIWVDDSGQHGIVAAPEDVPLAQVNGNTIGLPWGYVGYMGDIYFSAMGSGVYDGEKNTETIVSKLGWNYYAAFLCRQMNFGKYGGWYLPSIAELKLMYDSRSFLTGLSTSDISYACYWSSTESSAALASTINFFDGGVTNVTKTFKNVNVNPLSYMRARAVRRF